MQPFVDQRTVEEGEVVEAAEVMAVLLTLLDVIAEATADRSLEDGAAADRGRTSPIDPTGSPP